MAAVLMSVFPRVPVRWMVPVLLVYGFFFIASYPITEAAVAEAVHDSVRGRVFGLFITVGGLVGNLAHWAVGGWVERLGPRASLPESYLPIYSVLSLLVLSSLAALPFLHALRKREEEIALAKGFIDEGQFQKLAEGCGKSEYGDYLSRVLKERQSPDGTR